MTDREIFINAPLDGSPEALESYLAKACGGDEELEAKVRELIEEAGKVDEFMERGPLGEGAPPTVKGAGLVERAGSIIGHYKLLQPIGEGGFGVVYMAEQLEPVKRRVALKIIKLGMDTRQVVARFEAERQALAMMDHPNIAKIYDAGATETGRPYFVMELVRGILITDYCDDNNLSTDERLDLFIAVCQAVQHAHQKGVIHRDIKPSNVMISMHDDKAVPKVIDFGVAKATQIDLTDKTLFTQFEQFIGTPAYMSPEQAQLSGLDIDTRSDIYSLGVLLYELLTGTTPFDAKELAKAGMDEIRRVIREEEPPWPSLRLSTMGGAARTHLAKHRQAAPDKLPGQLRGDLDWIIMKSLEKDRTRRYETANGLAEDIRRHLADEPVSAGAPSAAYRVWKYARRHRAGLSVAAVITLLLVAGMMVSTWMAVERQRTAGELAEQLRITEDAQKKAETARTVAEVAQVEAENARAVADHSAREMTFLLADQDSVRGSLELARRLRNELGDRVTAARAMASMWQTEGPIPLSPPFHEDHAAITEDGRFIALGNENDGGTLRVVDAETGETVMSRQSGSPITGVGFSSDPHQRRLVTMGVKLPERHGLVEVWEWMDAEGGILDEPKKVGSFLHDDFLFFAHLSPDGTMVLTGGQNAHGLVWKVGSGETLRYDAAEKVEKVGKVGNLANRNTMTGCWSPDGTRVATGGTPQGNWQIDTTDGKRVVNRGQSHGIMGITSIRFNPKGNWVVTASHDGTAQVWDALTGEAVGKRLVHGAVVSHAEFNPRDGGQVLTASYDGTVRLWDAETGDPLLAPFEHPGGVEEAHFSPDGGMVISDCEDNHFRIWSAITGKLLEERDGVVWEHFQVGLGGRFADSGRRILALGGGGRQGHRRVWPLVGAKSLHQVFRHDPMTAWEHPGKILAADFHPTEPQLVSVSREFRARIWNRKTGELDWSLRILTEGRKPTVSYSPDGKRLLVATSDAGLQVSHHTPWGWAGLMPLEGDQVDEEEVVNVQEEPKGKEGKEEQGQEGNGEQVKVVKDRGAMVAHGEFSPLEDSGSGELRSRWIVSANYVGKKAQVWDAETGELKATLGLAGEDRCTFGSFSHDATRVVTAGKRGSVEVWEGDWGRGEEWVRKIAAFEVAGGGRVMALFHPADRSLVLCASRAGNRATIWKLDPETGEAKRIQKFPHDRTLAYAEWSPDGSRVVTASTDGTAQVWAWQDADGEILDKAARVGRALLHEDSVVRAEFSPDGRRVVTASQDGTARVWDAATGFPVCAPLDHQSPVNFARFSPDGRQVVTAGDDATLRLWDLPPLPEGAVPAWVPGWIEAVIGQRLEDDGSVTSVPEEGRKKVREEVASRDADDFYVRVAQWFYQARLERPITPFSEVTIEQYVKNRVHENTERSLEEALMMDPGNHAALTALASMLAKDPAGDGSDLRRAATFARRAALGGGSNTGLDELPEQIEESRRYARAKEQIKRLEQQAAETAEAGNAEAAESIIGTAILGWVLCAAEYGEPSLSRTMESRFPKLRAIMDERYEPEILISGGSSWRFPKQAENLGSDWATHDYDDSSWEEGGAPLGFSPEKKDGKTEDGEKTRIARDDGATTYVFRHTFEWDAGAFAPDDLRRLILRIRCDDGAVVHLNGVQVQRVNMPEAGIDWDTQALTKRSGEAERSWTLFLLARDVLRAGSNVLAVEVHQKHGQQPSSDLMLDLELKLQRQTSEFLRTLLSAAADSGELLDALALVLPQEVTPQNRGRWEMALAQKMASDLEMEDLKLRARVQALLQGWDGALEVVEEALVQHGESFEPAKVRRRKELLRAKLHVLSAAGRSKEAEAVREEILTRPPRNPALSPKLINLDEAKTEPGVYRGFFVAWATSGMPGYDSEAYWRERFAEEFPLGKTDEVALDFDIRGRIALNSGVFEPGMRGIPDSKGKDFQEATGKSKERPRGVYRPDSIEIPVGQVAEKLHFLQWCAYSREPEGVEVAHYLVHYEDGTESEPIPVIYGKDVAGLDIEIGSTPPERIAWEHPYKWAGRHDSRIALGIQTWENPNSEKVISHIDFVSAMVQAVPVLVAITVE